MSRADKLAHLVACPETAQEMVDLEAYLHHSSGRTRSIPHVHAIAMGYLVSTDGDGALSGKADWWLNSVSDYYNGMDAYVTVPQVRGVHVAGSDSRANAAIKRRILQL